MILFYDFIFESFTHQKIGNFLGPRMLQSLKASVVRIDLSEIYCFIHHVLFQQG